jgi:pimeloyl-ACP methyl ester carboxylesterase
MVCLRLHDGGIMTDDQLDTHRSSYTRARDAGAPTVVFIHGFLDDRHVWDAVVDELGDAVGTFRWELPGSGRRAQEVGSPRQLDLRHFAEELVAHLAEMQTAVILVGQSMGAQVAELAAAQGVPNVRGLILVTPVPLGGTHMPPDVVERFRHLGGDSVAQRSARRQISPDLSKEQLVSLDRGGLVVRPEIVARYVELWDRGVADAPVRSDYVGPVLIVRGSADGFVSDEMAATVLARFDAASVHLVPDGGHWLHVEQPRRVAAAIRDFAVKATAGAESGGWRQGFAGRSAADFAAALAEGVVLEASVLVKPIRGREHVAPVLAAASSIYESLVFTDEATAGRFTYLQWSAEAFEGTKFNGVTILEKDDDGKIVKAAIHKRPLPALLRFSATLKNLLVDVIEPEHFYDGPLPS